MTGTPSAYCPDKEPPRLLTVNQQIAALRQSAAPPDPMPNPHPVSAPAAPSEAMQMLEQLRGI